MQETWVRSLGREDVLEKDMATHSSIFAWEIPWTEQPGGLQSLGSQRVRHGLATETTAKGERRQKCTKYLLGARLCASYLCFLFRFIQQWNRIDVFMTILLMRKPRLPVFRSLDRTVCLSDGKQIGTKSLGCSDIHVSPFSITSFYCPLES